MAPSTGAVCVYPTVCRRLAPLKALPIGLPVRSSCCSVAKWRRRGLTAARPTELETHVASMALALEMSDELGWAHYSNAMELCTEGQDVVVAADDQVGLSRDRGLQEAIVGLIG